MKPFLAVPATTSSIVVLCADEPVATQRIAAIVGTCASVYDLEALDRTRGATLLSFGSGVIVPNRVLARFATAYNVHAASPEFPGRDPHHWAVYAGATRYGATMHAMTEKVDEGPIVAVELFDVPPGARPAELLARANEAGYRLLERMAPLLRTGQALPATGAKWRGVKRSRADLLALCQMGSDTDPDEINRRRRAFEGFPLRLDP